MIGKACEIILIKAPLAHAWLEQRTHNPLVRSSTLRGGTIKAAWRTSFSWQPGQASTSEKIQAVLGLRKRSQVQRAHTNCSAPCEATIDTLVIACDGVFDDRSRDLPGAPNEDAKTEGQCP